MNQRTRPQVMTAIRISRVMPSGSPVERVFCDCAGRLLQSQVGRHELAGPHAVNHNGAACAECLYLVRLKAGHSEGASQCLPPSA